MEVLVFGFFSVAFFFRSFLLDLAKTFLLEIISESDDKEMLESLTMDLEFLVGVLAWSVFLVGSFFRYFLLELEVSVLAALPEDASFGFLSLATSGFLERLSGEDLTLVELVSD